MLFDTKRKGALTLKLKDCHSERSEESIIELESAEQILHSVQNDNGSSITKYHISKIITPGFGEAFYQGIVLIKQVIYAAFNRKSFNQC
ncbi:hypothetical protein SAMN05421821_10792 [Mucilaginibacter lappiensis]|nr:hypothetical protein SAMN05421821_10792 [Mucilaginibacter lappiensis]